MTNVATLPLMESEARDLVSVLSSQFESREPEQHYQEASGFRPTEFLGTDSIWPIYVFNSSPEANWKDSPFHHVDGALEPTEYVQIERLRKMHGHFARYSGYATILTESVKLQEVEYARPALWNFRNLKASLKSYLETQKPDSTMSACLIALATARYLESSKNAAIFGHSSSIYKTLLESTQRESLMNSYIAILNPILGDIGYLPTDSYYDGIGGLVVDYLRSEARICLVLDDDHIQFLYINAGKVLSKSFEAPKKAKLEVLDFAQKEFS